jgi:hypothetical protein
LNDVQRTDFVAISTQDKERAPFFSDPDGNGLMLHRRYAPYSDGSQA